jgi:hypothetical protein
MFNYVYDTIVDDKNKYVNRCKCSYCRIFTE